ncbi:MAG: Asp-tRNA(Asn)/Glu-tRNA(Gln) amidotransferase subunit GatA [Chitinispirillaceae bacterium]|nr:Asp-tRNA(Asn)/Glu-tRNA(Gln) amidotransferase subunit GatA [Chitinispirillaceae bacterium]
MKSDSPLRLSIEKQREMLAQKELSSVELTEEYIRRIESVDGELGAFITTTFGKARKDAALADERIVKGESTPLLGVTIGIKDLIGTKGIPTTAGSKIIENYKPPYNATVIEKLEAAGAVIVGKLNLDEFGMGSSCENSAYKKTCNPWAPDRTPGGSSGGSAAAVAAAECAGALGTDTGGSIRQPASFCNVVGVKPTYGRVSRFGVVAYASSLDQVGTFARDVGGAAAVLQVIAGRDPHDTTSAPYPVPDFGAVKGTPVKGMKVGVPEEFFMDGLNPEIAGAVKKAVEDLEKIHGVEVVEISLPHAEYAVAAYYLVATAEASSNLARYDGAHFGYRTPSPATLSDMYTKSRSEAFGEEVKRRIMLGTFVLSAGYYDAYYLKALRVRRLIQKDFFDAFEKVDAVIAPTSPLPPFRLGELMDDPLQMYLADIYTVTASLAGLPAMSMPCGFTSSPELPIGMQIIAPPWQEETMFKLAFAYEEGNRYIGRFPGEDA